MSGWPHRWHQHTAAREQLYMSIISNWSSRAYFISLWGWQIMPDFRSLLGCIVYIFMYTAFSVCRSNIFSHDMIRMCATAQNMCALSCTSMMCGFRVIVRLRIHTNTTIDDYDRKPWNREANGPSCERERERPWTWPIGMKVKAFSIKPHTHTRIEKNTQSHTNEFMHNLVCRKYLHSVGGLVCMKIEWQATRTQ